MTDRITPDPHLINSVRSLDWDPAQAIAEPVDNSLAPGKGEAKSVTILVEPNAVTIRDDGLGAPDVNRLFQLGSRPLTRVPGDIGIYGVGVTHFAMWLGERLEVETVAGGRAHRHATAWSDKEWPARYEGAGRPAPRVEPRAHREAHDTGCRRPETFTVVIALTELSGSLTSAGRRIEGTHDCFPRLPALGVYAEVDLGDEWLDCLSPHKDRVTRLRDELCRAVGKMLPGSSGASGRRRPPRTRG